jgi:predicted nucleotidyltransferase
MAAVSMPATRPSEALARNRDAILELARQFGVSNVRVFGSVARGDDTADSDLDLLVDPGTETSLLDLARLEVAAEGLLGLSVDVVTPLGLSPRHRDSILQSARLL